MRILVLGATGMVGTALVRRLQMEPDYEILTGPVPRIDLRDQAATHRLLAETKPEWVFLAAARVGGIHANRTYPADFIYDNLMIQCNVFHAAFTVGVRKLLFPASSCIYPKFAPQPLAEDYLLTGKLEPTNEPYAVAKIAGIITAQSFNRQYGTNFISVMPSNLYGPNDNFDLKLSHVVPALIRKTHEAKVAGRDFVEVWGSGTPLREFLFVDDLADACVFLMRNYDESDFINIGTGKEVSIREVATLIKEVVGFDGELRFDSSMPDGDPRKVLDISRITALGWSPATSLREGLARTYEWYVANESRIRK
ncbi:MAG: GDP-L-fucose synthase [Thermodesulfobacteriota bacterium]